MVFWASVQTWLKTETSSCKRTLFWPSIMGHRANDWINDMKCERKDTHTHTHTHTHTLSL
jgi:hypothetical protein